MMSCKPMVLSAAVTVASLIGRAVLAADPAIYSSISGNTGSLYTINGRTNPSSNPNESGGEGGGDDFNTGYDIVNISGLTFYGGDTDPYQASAGAADPNQFSDGTAVTSYGVQISFYSSTGTKIASIVPSASEIYGIGWHTLRASDFSQNGASSIETYGAGYIVFQPYYQTVQKFNGVSVESFNAPTGTPQFTLGFGSVPTLGANDPTISVQSATPGPGVVSTGVYATAAGATAQYGQFELDGTGTTDLSTSPVWSATSSGNWDDSSKWTLGVPNSTSSTANFFEGITADSTVTLAAGETIGTVNFDNPLHRYTLAGSSTLTLSSSSGTATLNGWGGSHTISCPLAFTAGLNITTFPDPDPSSFSLTLPLAVTASGTLTKLGAGTLAFQPSGGGITMLNLPAISIGAGTVALESSGVISKRTLLVTTTLTISGGRLDLGANDMDLSGGGATGLSNIFAAVHQVLAVDRGRVVAVSPVLQQPQTLPISPHSELCSIPVSSARLTARQSVLAMC